MIAEGTLNGPRTSYTNLLQASTDAVLAIIPLSHYEGPLTPTILSHLIAITTTTLRHPLAVLRSILAPPLFEELGHLPFSFAF